MLVCDFLWPCSWAQLNLRQNKNEVNHTDSENLCMPTAVCLTSGAIAAACELLVALCYRCSPNMALLTSLLTDLFYSGMILLRQFIIFYVLIIPYNKNVL